MNILEYCLNLVLHNDYKLEWKHWEHQSAGSEDIEDYKHHVVVFDPEPSTSIALKTSRLVPHNQI